MEDYIQAKMFLEKYDVPGWYSGYRSVRDKIAKALHPRPVSRTSETSSSTDRARQNIKYARKELKSPTLALPSAEPKKDSGYPKQLELNFSQNNMSDTPGLFRLRTARLKAQEAIRRKAATKAAIQRRLAQQAAIVNPFLPAQSQERN